MQHAPRRRTRGPTGGSAGGEEAENKEGGGGSGRRPLASSVNVSLFFISASAQRCINFLSSPESSDVDRTALVCGCWLDITLIVCCAKPAKDGIGPGVPRPSGPPIGGGFSVLSFSSTYTYSNHAPPRRAQKARRRHTATLNHCCRRRAAAIWLGYVCCRAAASAATALPPKPPHTARVTGPGLTTL